MPRVTYHISPFGNGWKVAAEGQDLDIVRDNKEDALEAARGLAKSQELAQIVVHGQDGQIQEEFTYGEDPRETPG